MHGQTDVKMTLYLNIAQSLVDSQGKGFLNRFLLKSWRLTQIEQKPAKDNDKAANRALSFNL